MTIPKMIFRDAELHLRPAPGQYEVDVKEKKSGVPTSTSPHRVVFDDDRAHGKTHKGYLYHPEKGDKHAMPRIPKAKLTPYTNRLEKLERDKELELDQLRNPHCCSYDPQEAFISTQLHGYERQNKRVVDKGKKLTFVDHHMKYQRKLPGAGTYKKVESAYNHLSRSPSSPRRH